MDAMDIWRAGSTETEIVGQLLHDFNVEYAEPTPGPSALGARIGELLQDGDTVVLLGGDTERSMALAVAVLRFRKAIWSSNLECYLAELYVVPEYRGRDLGRAMLAAVIEQARTQGADYIDLGTSEDDVAARGGFTRASDSAGRRVVRAGR